MTIPIWYLSVSIIVLIVGLILNGREVAEEPYFFYTGVGFAILWPISIPIDIIRYLVTR
jgi:hypothetical protein